MYLKYIARRKGERHVGSDVNRTNRESGGSMGPIKSPRECPVSRFPGICQPKRIKLLFSLFHSVVFNVSRTFNSLFIPAQTDLRLASDLDSLLD